MKSKIHKVTVLGLTFYVLAKTKAGACRIVARHLADETDAVIASADDIYDAGRRGVAIMGLPGAQQAEPTNPPTTDEE